MSRAGILGGSFSPPHVAHLIISHIVREAMELDRVVLIPTYQHAIKTVSSADPKDRVAMTELAVAGDPALEADRIEVDRGGTSYTVDTLAALREREPETKWFLILGQDNLAELEQWHQFERLPDLAEIVVTTRGGVDQSQLVLPFGGRCTLVPVPALEISSTRIRQRVASGRTIRYWVPPAVEAYIGEHDLYVQPRSG